MFNLAASAVLSKLFPSQHLLVQIQQWKHEEDVLNMIKVHGKETKTTSVFIINFEQISDISLVFPLSAMNK